MDTILEGLKKDWVFHCGIISKNNSETVYPLSLGNPNVPLDKRISNAICKSLLEGNVNYLSVRGLNDINICLANLFSVKPENIQVTHGAQSALYLSMKTAYLFNKKPFLIINPPYLTTIDTIKSFGASYYSISHLDELKTFDKDVGTVLIMNPVSPTGKVWTKEELNLIGKFCKEKDLLCISDEVYSDLIYNGTHTSVLSIPDLKERCCAIYSASKSFSMPGLRVGWMVTSSDWIEHVSRLMSSTHASLSGSILNGFKVALENRNEILSVIKHTLKERLDTLYPYISEYCDYPDAGIFLLLKTKNPYEIAQKLFDRNISSVTLFDIGIKDRLRLSFSHDVITLNKVGPIINKIMGE